MSLVDIVVIALIALFAVIGVLSGVKKSALSLVAFILAFVIAFFLAKVVAEALLGIEAIRRFVIGRDGWSLYTLIYNGFQPSTLSEFCHSTFYKPILDIISTFNGYTAEFTIEQGAALYMAFTMFAALVGVALFLVVRLLLAIVTMIIKAFFDKKKSGIGRLFGLLVGMVQGAAWALAISVVFSNMAGFAFISAFKTVEEEYETSVIAKYINVGAYAVRDNLFLPDESMYERIIGRSGITIKAEDKEQGNALLGKKLDLYIDLKNLNYDSSSPYTKDPVTGYLVTPEDESAGRIDYTIYYDSGFDFVVKAILDYNDAAAKKIIDGNLESSIDLSAYEAYIQTGGSSIYNIWMGNNGDTNCIITLLRNYEMTIDSNKDLSSQEAVDYANGKLISQYNVIVEELQRLKTAYGDISAAFGELNYTLPIQYVIPDIEE